MSSSLENGPRYRSFGPAPVVAAQPSRWMSAFGAFAISYVVSVVVGFGLGIVLGGAFVVDTARGDGVDDTQLTAGIVVVYLISTAAATLAAARHLSGRKVGNAITASLVGNLAGLAGGLLPEAVDPTANLGLVLSAVAQVLVTYLVIRPAVPRAGLTAGAPAAR